MRFRFAAPFLWLVPGLVLLLAWRTTFAPPGLAWWCMLLWLPIFLAGVAQAGFSFQSRRRAEGRPALSITYREVFRLRPLALLALLVGTLASVAAVLCFTYPERPTTMAGWLALVFFWPVSWLTWSWLRTLLSSKPRAKSDA